MSLYSHYYTMDSHARRKFRTYLNREQEGLGEVGYFSWQCQGMTPFSRTSGGNPFASQSLGDRGNRHGKSMGTVFW
jgi:hypothetical protein